ncbi:MAG TPA: hypothetical protein VEK08_24735 [Planctomycetota bacterium]|nr:hypothetical protein [Planctomycetota bacterium]
MMRNGFAILFQKHRCALSARRGSFLTYCRTLAVVFAIVLRPLLAHDSPEHVIEQLTELLAREPAPDLLTQRAMHYRLLREFEKASGDIESALALRPDYYPAQLERVKLLIAEEKYSNAAAAASASLALRSDGEQRFVLLSLRAQALSTCGRHTEALADCSSLLESRPDDVEILLLRANLRWRAGQLRQSAAELSEAFALTGAAVLQEEWIETLLDCGEFAAARETIEKELSESRLKSTWLIRRARCQRGDAVRNDLARAIAEIDLRLRPERPDLQLLLERAHATALLGLRAEAERSLKAAMSAGANGICVARVKAALENSH